MQSETKISIPYDPPPPPFFRVKSKTDISIPIYPANFPHRRKPGNPNSAILAVISNLKYMFRKYKITSNYNQITKNQIINIPGLNVIDGLHTVNIETIISLAALNRLPIGNIANQTIAIAYEKSINPVVKYLKSLHYSNDNHIQSLANSLCVDPDSENIRNIVFRMFMISACAAADHASSTSNKEAKAKFEYMMILVGKQGIEKTKFFKNMLPKPLQIYFKDGQFLDPSDKDSVLKCMMYWVNEIGEVDNSFCKSDNARIKAFLSESEDILRPPFGRVVERFHRRTIFVGSTNERNFLKDYTGNRRYWPLDIISIKMPDEHVVNSAWGEAWQAYVNGEQWWPDSELEDLLNEHRLAFNASITDDSIDETIQSLIESKKGIFGKDILRGIDIQNYLKISANSRHGSGKVPSILTINKTMKQFNLGLEVQVQRKYWVVHNIEKYKGMRPSEIEKCYIPPYFE